MSKPSTEEKINWYLVVHKFPVLDEKNKRELYVEENLPSDIEQQFKEKNWIPVNILGLSQDSESDIVQYIKKYMTGVRMGTIAPSEKRYKILELESKVLGISYANKSKLGEIDQPKGKLFNGLISELDKNKKLKNCSDYVPKRKKKTTRKKTKKKKAKKAKSNKKKFFLTRPSRNG